MANLGYIQVTRLCNQACRFCSNPPNRNTLSYEEGVKEIEQLRAQGYDGVIFTGGEPTLSPHLPELIAYCTGRSFPCRVITNGQEIADPEHLKMLYGAGLRHLHLSVYSIRENIQAALTRNPASQRNILSALENLSRNGAITVDVNTVINKYNADHLSENVRALTERFPFLKHFVWNNLDPTMNRAAENPDTVPRLNDFEVELKKAVDILEKTGRTYRVERVPLCYMNGFEHTSTETRKIIKGEERTVFFLDEKGAVRQQRFEYGKAPCCQVCRLNEICAGLYEMDRYYASDELYPVFKNKEVIKRKVLTGED